MVEYKMNTSNTTHHDAFVDEASPIPCRFQMWVFFCAGNSDVPDLFPGIIKLNMYWIDSRVVWSHCIAQVSWNTMFLKHDRTMAALKNLRNLMFWHFSNALFVKDQEQEMKVTVISKYADLEGDGRQHGEDETQDFKTKAFLPNIFMSTQGRRI